MPLYDILNEFQKGSSHMAAVVKVKEMSKTPQAISVGEKFEGNRVTTGKSQLTTPLLTKDDYMSKSIVIDINRTSKPNTDKQIPPLHNDAPAKSLPQLLECIEEGEVIGIITLEDVFEELLQVSSLLSFKC